MSRKIVITGVWLLAMAGVAPNSLFAQSHGTHISTPSVISHPQPSEHASTAPRNQNAATSPHVTFIQRIDANPQLVARLTPLLPSGMTLDQAAAGFKNQGQFIAALHVSKNVGVDFAQLKAEMTGSDHDSLGKAIRDLKPSIDAKTAAKTAEDEAKADVKATRPTTAPKSTGDTDDTK